jgi:Rieske Fe-S protein
MERRTFLTWATHGLGALFAAVLGIPAIAFLIDPRNRPKPPGGFRKTLKITDLEVGVPKQVVIRDQRRDAWTFHPNDVIGRVWLLRRGDREVDAYTTICPHLGCSVNFTGGQFVCPCHNGTFTLQGEQVVNAFGHKPVPRDMDRLKVDFDPSDPDMVLVEYKNFYQGKPEPIERTRAAGVLTSDP